MEKQASLVLCDLAMPQYPLPGQKGPEATCSRDRVASLWEWSVGHSCRGSSAS